MGPRIDWEYSADAVAHWMSSREVDILVITGFIATNTEGIPTTLGRNGSDFSASMFASLLDAKSVHIWTDVDGVMSANPRQVPDAHVLDALSYKEAMELAYFGAGVIHPRTMAPVVKKSIPIFIRNTFKPELAGTRIHLPEDAPLGGPAPSVKRSEERRVGKECRCGWGA